MKHKLLQTWARKSAKLLAAFALLASTSFATLADDSVTLTFSCTQNTGSQISKANASKVDYMFDSDSQSLISSLTDPSNLNGGVALNGKKAVRFGSYASGAYNKGSLTINLKESYKIKSIDVTLTTYKSTNNKAPKNPTWNLDINGHQMVTTLSSDVTTATTYNIPFVGSADADGDVQTLTVKSTDAPVDVYSLTLNLAASDPNQPAAPTFTPDGGEVDANSTVTIAGDDKTLSLKYWFGEDETAATTVTGAAATVTITEACTLNAVAIGEGDVESGVKTASYTLAPAKHTYKQITAELTSGKYVFMCGENFVNPVLVSNRCNFTDDFTKTDDEIVASEKYEFTITVDGEYATIQGVDGKYLGINAAGNNYFTQGTDASTNNFKWKFTVDNGVVTFTSAISDTNVLAQHMGTSSLYENFAPGKVEGSVYPTLYKLYVAPEAPELPSPTAAENVTITEGDDSWTIRPESYPVTLTFDVEEGVQIYAKSISDTQAQAAAEGDNDGYTALEGNTLTLTARGDNYSVYAMKDGVKSVAKTIVADAATGIAGIEAEDGEAVYFNLQGVRVQNPENGVFIRVQNGKAVKIAK